MCRFVRTRLSRIRNPVPITSNLGRGTFEPGILPARNSSCRSSMRRTAQVEVRSLFPTDWVIMLQACRLGEVTTLRSKQYKCSGQHNRPKLNELYCTSIGDSVP